MQTLKNWSIKRKLVTFTLATSILTLASALCIIIVLDRIDTRENIIDEVTTFSEVMAANSTAAVDFSDPIASQRQLNALAQAPEYTLGCLYTRDGALLASYSAVNNASNCPNDAKYDLINFEPVTRLFIHRWTPIVRNKTATVGHLYIQRSLRSLNSRATRFATTSVLVTIAMLGIGYLIIVSTQGVISRPILYLSELSDRIAKGGNYELRAEIDQDDEMGKLAKAFNSMLGTIEQSERDLKYMAFNDALTGLPNRRYFLETLDRSMNSVTRGYHTLALLLIDLDGFKSVNDTIGHDAGDFVLAKVSERVPQVIRKGDMFARLGGDEFTILLNDIASPAAIRKIALQVIKAIEEPLRFQKRDASVSASVGIAMAPSDNTQMAELLKAADEAMYRAKEGGKGTFYFFDKLIDARMKELDARERAIATALAKDQLSNWFQPLIHVQSGTVHGVLIRTKSITRMEGDLEHVYFVRQLADPELAEQVETWLLADIYRHLDQIAKHGFNISNTSGLELIMPVTNALIQNSAQTKALKRLCALAARLRIKLRFAIRDPQPSRNLNDPEILDHLICCDDGLGLELLSHLEQQKPTFALCSLPTESLDEWQELAWRNLVSASKTSGTKLVGIQVDDPRQRLYLQHFKMPLGVGTAISPLKPMREFPSWFVNQSENVLSGIG